jgi:hypothetical protein
MESQGIAAIFGRLLAQAKEDAFLLEDGVTLQYTWFPSIMISDG